MFNRKIGTVFYITADIVDIESSKIIESQKIKADSLEQIADKTEPLAKLLSRGEKVKETKIETIPDTEKKVEEQKKEIIKQEILAQGKKLINTV